MESQPTILDEDLESVLKLAEKALKELKGKRIFISGGTGFFGFWLLQSFCRANAVFDLDSTATVLTRSPEAFQQRWPDLADNPGIALVKGDIRDFTFPEGEFAFGIHAATPVVDLTKIDAPLELFSTIVDGTRRYLDFAVASKMKKLLFISSGAVYGTQPPDLSRIPEEYQGAPDPALPTSAYGEGKRAAEQLCVLYGKKYGIDSKIARCFAFVGPELPLNGHFAIGNFILNSLRNEDLLIKGDGTPVRTYLYAADLAVWLWMLLANGASGRPYNIGSEHPYSIFEIAQAVSRCTAATGEIRVANASIRGKPCQRYVPSIERCKRELGVGETYSLEQAITRTVLYERMRRTGRATIKSGDANEPMSGVSNMNNDRKGV